MDQRSFWMLGFLLLAVSSLGKCSVADNEISSLEDDSKTTEPPFPALKAGFNVNLVVDAILVATRSAIEAAHDSEVRLDPVDSDFQIPLQIATLTGHVKLVNGTLRALNSIERRGDAKLIPRILHRELDVVATLGLKTAVAEYYYYLQLLGIHPNGNLTAVVGDNAVTIEFALSFDRQGCHFKLKELKMARLGDVQVSLTGLYPFDGLSSRLASKMIEPLDGQLAEKVETTLRYYINQELGKMPCTKLGII